MEKKKGTKRIKVLHSLFENEKRNQNNNNGDEDETGAAAKTFNCDICHFDDHTTSKFARKDIEFLEEKDQIMMKFKMDREIKILCSNHYKTEVSNMKYRQKKCCNVLNNHKGKPRKTMLQTITVRQAEDAKKFLGIKMIPYLDICRDCSPKLDQRIEEARKIEDHLPDPLPDNNDNTDYAMDSQTEEDAEEVDEDGSCDDKHEILSKIADQVDDFTRAQKIAIIRVLPASWSIREISAHTGKINK